MRRLLLTLHLWLGCVAALLFIILGVTGSVMVFEEEIDRALNSKMTWVTPSGPRLPVAQIVLQCVLPGSDMGRPDVVRAVSVIGLSPSIAPHEPP
jgi:hypothetical protein